MQAGKYLRNKFFNAKTKRLGGSKEPPSSYISLFSSGFGYDLSCHVNAACRSVRQRVSNAASVAYHVKTF